MRLLITDDEPLIHISIEVLLKECAIPDLKIFHANSGTEMLTLLKEEKINIALVDIKMPGISGLEGIELGKRLSPDTTYYIMTGFQEFEYAKKAIRLGVQDYLLKPLDKPALLEVIQKELKEKEMRDARKRDALRNWLESTLDGRDAPHDSLNSSSAALALLTFDKKDGISEEWIKNTLLTCHNQILSLLTDAGLLLLIYAREPESVQKIIRSLMTTTLPEAHTLFISSVCKNPEALKKQLAQVTEAAPLRIFAGLQNCYRTVNLKDFPANLQDFSRDCVKWKEAYYQAEFTTYTSKTTLLISKLAGLKLTARQYQNILLFFSCILDTAISEGLSAEELKNHLLSQGNLLLQGKNHPQKLDAVLDYIKEHYTDKDISIVTLANLFSLSPNYLSTLLRNRLNMKFMDYITQLRISTAKNLLATTSLSMKVITEQCGYFSQSYFTKLFTEHVKCTPSEYRKAFKQDS